MPPQQSVKPRHSIETISVWVLIASLVVAVFAFIPSASASFVATKAFVLAAGALLAFAAYTLARLSRGNVILPPALLVGALWFPVIAYALSAAFSGVPFMNALWGTSLEADTLGFMFAAALLGTMTALVLRRPEHYRTFLHAGVCTFAVLVALQVLILIVGQFAPSTVSPSFSPLGSVQDLASLLGLGVIGILIALRELDFDLRARRVLLACVIGAMVLLAVANVALVWILLALVSLGFFVESVMQRGNRGGDADLADVSLVEEEPLSLGGGNRPLVMPLIVLVVALFFLIGGQLGDALAGALHTGQVQVRPSWQATLSVGQKVYSATPVFGSGPSTFGVEWLKYRDASLNSTIFWNIDFASGIGFIPTSAVTTGLVGVIAWIAFLALFVVFGLRMLIRRAPEDAFTRYVAFFSFLASVYLFTLAIFDLPSAVMLALAFVFAGLFASTMRFGARGGQWGVIFSRSPRLGFIIVFVLTVLLLGSVVAAYTLVGRALASYQFGAASNAFAAGNLDAADAAARSSASFAATAPAYQLGAGIARARLVQIASSTTMPAAAAQKAFQDTLSSGISAALASTNLSPSDYQGWLVLGNLYSQAVPLGVTGAYEGAKVAYGKAQALNPTNPQIPYIMAELDIANKDFKAAQEDLKAAIALKQDYTTAILLLSQLEVQDGNVKEALNSALAAAYFTPNDPSILFQIGILYAVQNDLTNAGAALNAAVSSNPQFANARYFLAAVYAKQGDLKNAQEQVQAIADMSADNAKAVASQLAELAAGTNPFPANLLSLSSAPVK